MTPAQPTRDDRLETQNRRAVFESLQVRERTNPGVADARIDDRIGCLLLGKSASMRWRQNYLYRLLRHLPRTGAQRHFLPKTIQTILNMRIGLRSTHRATLFGIFYTPPRMV